jgi:hypothetical protein
VLRTFSEMDGDLLKAWKEILYLALANRSPNDVAFFGAFAEFLNLNGMPGPSQIW